MHESFQFLVSHKRFGWLLPLLAHGDISVFDSDIVGEIELMKFWGWDRV